jgi:polyisoprenyl-phosphate glycosyltransferase
MNDQITLSIVAPVFNESASLPEFYRRVCETMTKLGELWELVLVDDGSRDNCAELMRELALKDPHVRPVIFARNFGHQLAVTAGLDYSRGRAVVIIDSDLQDPPEVIPDLVAKWHEGYEVVYAVRKEREGETWFKLFTASLFYHLIYHITEVDIPRDTGDFRLLDRKVVNVLNQMRERHRFLRGMSVWVGFRQAGVGYKRHARFAGETKYPLKKMIKFASDAITGFSYLPLQIATYIGFISAIVAIFAIPFVIVMRLTVSHGFLGQASTLISVLFLGGVQLICLGILGEYLGRLYDEARGRPLYIIRDDPETILFDNSKFIEEKI